MGVDHPLTWEADLKHDGLLPVFDRADGGELEVEQAEEGTRQQAHQAHEHAVVAGICILVEDTVETLTAEVNVTLIHNGGKDHQGEYLCTGGARREDRENPEWGGDNQEVTVMQTLEAALSWCLSLRPETLT